MRWVIIPAAQRNRTLRRQTSVGLASAFPVCHEMVLPASKEQIMKLVAVVRRFLGDKSLYGLTSLRAL